MIEQTVEIRVEMDGDQAVWMSDANVVLMPSHLDEVGRQRALVGLMSTWRRQWIRVMNAA